MDAREMSIEELLDSAYESEDMAKVEELVRRALELDPENQLPDRKSVV